MKREENNYAFVDSQNLNLAILDCGWKLDFKKFRHPYFFYVNDLKEKLEYKKKVESG